MSREEQLRQIALEELAREELEQEEKEKEVSPEQAIAEADIGYTGPESKEELEQFGKGFQMGAVEGVPFAKDVAAGLETLYESGTKNFGEEYQANLAEWNDEINKAEVKYPSAFMAGELASGIAMPIKGLKGAIAFGGLASASRLEDRDPFEMAQEAVKGAALGAGAMGLAKIPEGLNFVRSRLGKLGAMTTKEAVGAFSGANIKKLNRHIRKTGNAELSHLDNTVDFARRIQMTKVEGEPLLGSGLRGQSFARTAEKAEIAMQSHGRKLGKIVEEIDTVIGTPVSAKPIFDRLKSKMGIDDMLNSPDPDTVELGRRYLDKIKAQFQDVVEETIPTVVKKPMIGANGQAVLNAKGEPVLVDEVVETVKKSYQFKELTPKQIQQMKLDHSSTSRKVSSGFEKLGDASKSRSLTNDEFFDTNLNSVLDDTMQDLNAIVAKVNPELANAYTLTNRDYSDMIMVKKLAQDSADAQSGGAMERIKRALGVRGLLVAQVSSTTGSNIALSAATSSVINEAIQDPSTSVKMAKALSAIGDRVTKDPNSPVLKRIVVAAQVAMNDDKVSDEVLENAIAASAAEIKLLESPIKRNISDIKNKSDYILELMTFEDKDMAGQLRNALHTGDDETVRMIINSFSKDAQLKDIFEDGKGIDGRVYTEQEKKELRDELNAQDISLNQRLRLEKELDMNGTIPVIQQEPDRFLEFRKRDKDKPRY